MATKIKGSNLTSSTFIIPGDLQVDGTTTTINSTTLTVDDKNLVLASGAGNAAAADGAGLTVDGASASLTYASSGDKFSFNKPLDVTGTLTANGDVAIDSDGGFLFDVSEKELRFGDNYVAEFGDGGDLRIFHNGTHSFIRDQGTGQLRLTTNILHVTNGANNETQILANAGGSVELYHDNVKKFETTSVGVGVDQVFGLSDTDTGIALGANGANIMQFYTGNSERVRIDASGNVGIGTTSPVMNGVGTLLHIHASTATNLSGLHLTNNESGSGAADGLIVAKWSDGTNYLYDYENKPIVFGTNNAERMRILGSGNVGIGTTSPGMGLHISGSASSNNYGMRVVNTDASGYSTIQMGGTDAGIYRNGSSQTTYGGASSLNLITVSGHPIAFSTSNALRMQIDGSGNVTIAGTSLTPGLGNTTTGHALRADGIVSFSGASSYLNINRNGTGTIQQFSSSGNAKGSVTIASNGVTYATTSDIRLKQDIEPLDATDKLMAMNPVSYNWKADPDGPKSMGFIAHEMQEIMPDAVSTGEDADAMMSMDYGRITPIIVSALQKALQEIDILKDRIAELEAK